MLMHGTRSILDRRWPTASSPARSSTRCYRAHSRSMPAAGSRSLYHRWPQVVSLAVACRSRRAGRQTSQEWGRAPRAGWRHPSVSWRDRFGLPPRPTSRQDAQAATLTSAESLTCGASLACGCWSNTASTPCSGIPARSSMRSIAGWPGAAIRRCPAARRARRRFHGRRLRAHLRPAGRMLPHGRAGPLNAATLYRPGLRFRRFHPDAGDLHVGSPARPRAIAEGRVRGQPPQAQPWPAIAESRHDRRPAG